MNEKSCRHCGATENLIVEDRKDGPIRIRTILQMKNLKIII
jgi:hypothetical protein